ncbi:MAG: hypothetical protein J6W19_00615 [Prevotella sp.]|nr:hypothetical protein [Prevotella sp.]
MLLTLITYHLSLITSFAQFTLRQEHDSLYWLNDWRLPYPVYRFCTGDVDGDGSEDALVGVVKSTRYHKEIGRRLFIFHLVNGKARPLWMGSKLGGILQDFRFVDGFIRSLETTADGRYVVAEYRWDDFGLAFERFLVKNVDKETALSTFDLYP